MESSNKTMKTKSQKGKWGHIGAPPKAVKFPNRPFTMEAAIKLNKCADGGPCELTVRKNVTAALNGYRISNGVKVTVPKTLAKGEPIPQPNGKVGRPKFRFVPIVSKVAGDPAKPAASKPAGSKPARVAKPQVKSTAVVSVSTVTPINTPATVPTAVSVPVEQTTPVVS